MIDISTRNYHSVVPQILAKCLTNGTRMNSEVLGWHIQIYDTIRICYSSPQERAMFWSTIGMSPASQFVLGLGAIHDNMESLKSIIEQLRESGPDDMVVLQQANPQIAFYVTLDKTLMMVTEHHSEEIIGGAISLHGVACSFLQEYIARSLGYHVGSHLQVLFDAWTAVGGAAPLAVEVFGAKRFTECPYKTETVTPYELFKGTDTSAWHADLHTVLTDTNPLEGMIGIRDKFFRRVAVPIIQAYEQGNDSDYTIHDILTTLRECKATDWALACRWFYEHKQGGHDQ